LVVILALAAVVGVCAVNLRCNGGPEPGSAVVRIRDDLREGRRAQRMQEADSLAVTARDLRVLAQRYLKQGDKKKAQRAIGAAQELDKRIHELMEPEQAPAKN